MALLILLRNFRFYFIILIILLIIIILLHYTCNALYTKPRRRVHVIAYAFFLKEIFKSTVIHTPVRKTRRKPMPEHNQRKWQLCCRSSTIS